MIDILITSSSRPDLLCKTIETMQQKIKYSGSFRWLLHEDVLDNNKSAQVKHYAKYSRQFDVIVASDPSVGLGQSIYMMFPYIKSDIFFRTDDDWEYVREIDLDPIISIFEHHEKVNQIIFNKRCIAEFQNTFKRKSIEFDNIWLTVTRSWGWIPALWRTDFVRRHYKLKTVDSNIEFFNNLKGREDITAEYMEQNIGSYFLGKIGDKGEWVKHTGGYDRSCDKGGRLGIY